MQDTPEPHSHDLPPEALPPATGIARAGGWTGAHDRVVLTYDERLLRRKRLETVHEETFVVNLAQVTHVDHGDAFVLEDGRLIEVVAAEEPLLEISGPHLTAVAWHIGNRHTPCQIEPDRLLIRQDHVLAVMLAQLGAGLRAVSEPFTPVGGAYGLGRTMGHEHGHDHGHDHDHSDEPAARKPTVLSRTGRVQHVEPEDLPADGPFGDDT
ncbi:MAG: urease accessory protein UreE [Gemmobacter sp.]